MISVGATQYNPDTILFIYCVVRLCMMQWHAYSLGYTYFSRITVNKSCGVATQNSSRLNNLAIKSSPLLHLLSTRTAYYITQERKTYALVPTKSTKELSCNQTTP